MASQQDQSELLALQVLGWLAGNDDLFTAFLSASGASVDHLSRSAQEPAFLASVLDFLMTEDAWVMAFCDATGHGYGAPMAARVHLPGGQAMNWT